jgi:hypothetical protein
MSGIYPANFARIKKENNVVLDEAPSRYRKATSMIAVLRFVLPLLHFPNPLTTLQPFRSLPQSSNTSQTTSTSILYHFNVVRSRKGAVVGTHSGKAWQSMIMDICIGMGDVSK